MDKPEEYIARSSGPFDRSDLLTPGTLPRRTLYKIEVFLTSAEMLRARRPKVRQMKSAIAWQAASQLLPGLAVLATLRGLSTIDGGVYQRAYLLAMTVVALGTFLALGVPRVLMSARAEGGEERSAELFKSASVLCVWLFAAGVAVSSLVFSAAAAILGLRNADLVIVGMYCVALPPSIASAIFRGYAEGAGAAAWSGRTRLLTVTAITAAPLLALTGIPLWLAAGAAPVAATVELILLYTKLAPPSNARKNVIPEERKTRAILKSAAWAGAAGLASPLFISLDRWVLADKISMPSSAEYSFVADLSWRLLAVPGAITISLAPLIFRSAQPSQPRMPAAQIWRACVYAGMLAALVFGSTVDVASRLAGIPTTQARDFLTASFSIALLLTASSYAGTFILYREGQWKKLAAFQWLQVLPFSVALYATSKHGAIATAAVVAARSGVDLALLLTTSLSGAEARAVGALVASSALASGALILVPSAQRELVSAVMAVGVLAVLAGIVRDAINA